MSSSDVANTSALQKYYKLHASIYDATRWSFLFGRQKIIDLAAKEIDPKTILEVGCGTGRNLQALAKAFPNAEITGLDLSSDMLAIAEKKLANNPNINVVEQKYDKPITDSAGNIKQYDLILFSYALSMFNPGWDEAIEAASDQLSHGGMVAVVDFHHSRFKFFRNWMQVNHVRMEAHLQPFLQEEFSFILNKPINAYQGIWQYLLFIGRKK